MHPHETVDRALRLSAQGLPDRQVAALCGVSASTVRRWRTDAGRAHATPNPRRHSCPRCHGRDLDGDAYAHLLGLYLGDGHLVRCRKQVFQLSLFCGDAWPGLIDEAAAAMARVMPTSSVSRRQRIGCTEVKSYAKHWPCLFPQHGPGAKHRRAIRLADWQREIVSAHPGRFVRGLMHSDGYRGINHVRRVLPSGERWYAYPRYLFKNESADILGLCGEALDLLDVAWRYNKRNEISVAAGRRWSGWTSSSGRNTDLRAGGRTFSGKEMTAMSGYAAYGAVWRGVAAEKIGEVSRRDTGRWAPMPLSVAAREAFLAESHIAAVAVDAGSGRGPLNVPVWYDYSPGGEVRFLTDGESLKARLIFKAGRFSLLAQRASPTYRYVAVEGPVVASAPTTLDELAQIAARYLPPDAVPGYVDSSDTRALVTFRMRPERWLSADLGAL